jgi:predicted nucleotidyltransferase
MTVQGELLHMLATVAAAIGADLREKLVFVGGCSTALLITDPVTTEDIRMTNDVDLIVSLGGFPGWAALQEQLRDKGFTVSSEDEVICRMRLGILKVDFMPDDEKILGFSNRWYKQGIETAIAHQLTDNLQIRHLTAPYFVATKFEAYGGRGNDDPLGSHDLEDVLIVVDGREELLPEVLASEAEVRRFVAEQFRALLDHRDFDNFLEGNITGPKGRTDIVRGRIEALANCSGDD